MEFPSIFGDFIHYELALKLGLVKFITFHQSYSYEEFIEGIRPGLGFQNELAYSLEDGIFKSLSIKAKYDVNKLELEEVVFDAGRDITNFSTPRDNAIVFGSIDNMGTAKINNFFNPNQSIKIPEGICINT